MAGLSGNESALNAPEPAVLATLRVMRDALRALTRLGRAEDADDLVVMAAALDRIETRHAIKPVPATAGSPVGASQPGDDFDASRLDRLLTLAGPRDAAELLSRIESDLSDTATRIENALPGADRDALRAASHVLVAVAGSVGALGLEVAARRFNTAALAEGAAPSPELAETAAAVLRGIAALKCRLAARRTEGP